MFKIKLVGKISWYFKNKKQKIKRKINLLSHSYFSPYTLYFIRGKRLTSFQKEIAHSMRNSNIKDSNGKKIIDNKTLEKLYINNLKRGR
jgi:hypothetical protein